MALDVSICNWRRLHPLDEQHAKKADEADDATEKAREA
jgi:hypothetical protein